MTITRYIMDGLIKNRLTVSFPALSRVAAFIYIAFYVHTYMMSHRDYVYATFISLFSYQVTPTKMLCTSDRIIFIILVLSTRLIIEAINKKR